MLLLLDLNDGVILEGPLDNVCLLAGALDILRLGQGRPELGEILELDEVPYVRQRRCLRNRQPPLLGCGFVYGGVIPYP